MYRLQGEKLNRFIYDQMHPMGENEVPADEYLRRLSSAERRGLKYLFSEVFRERYCRSAEVLLPMVMAVGTTTFPEEYWQGLEKYLQETDPSKLGFVERRGEDIDLLICSDTDVIPHSPEEGNEGWARQTDLSLTEAGVFFERSYDKKEDGTGYLTVPQDHQREFGRVRRYKSLSYGQGTTFQVYLPGCRLFHLFFKGQFLGETKLKYERTKGNPFSLLFRYGSFWDLGNLVDEIEEENKK